MVRAGRRGSAGPASVCAERSRYRLKSKQGLLVRGAGQARLADDGSVACVSLDAQRTIRWKGEERRSIAVRSA